MNGVTGNREVFALLTFSLFRFSLAFLHAPVGGAAFSDNEHIDTKR